MKNFNQFTPPDHRLLSDFSRQDDNINKYLTPIIRKDKNALQKISFYRTNIGNPSVDRFVNEIAQYYLPPNHSRLV